MSAALDLGSSEFRSLRRVDDRLIARRLPAVYTMVDDTPANRKVLEQSRYTYSATEGALVVIGDAAPEVSSLLSRPLIPLLPGGRLDDQDPIGRQVCVWLIELLLPQATHHNQQCLISLPRGEMEAEGASGWTSKFLEHVVQLQGYQTEIISPVSALALGELEDSEFTGICMDIGAEAINFGVIRQSQPLLTSRFLKGSRDIIDRFAHARRKYFWDHSGHAYIDFPSIQNWLAQGDISLISPGTQDEEWLADAYSELLLSALFSVKRKLRDLLDVDLKKPLPVVLSGGPVRLAGFSQLVQEAIELSHLPIHIAGIRNATFEPYSVARGLLIQATLNAGEEVQSSLAVEAA
jgi:Actin-like ATPase involved in cell division